MRRPPLRLGVLAALPVVAACLSGCPKRRDAGKPELSGRAEAPDASSGRDGDEHAELPKRVRLSAQVVADARIRTAPVARELLAVTLALPGEIASDPDKTARVASPVAGRLVDVRLREGSVVKKGDVLATVRVPEIGRVRSSYGATTSKATAARANADRLGALAERGLGARQEALTASAEASALEAEARGLGEQLGALGMGAGGGGSDLLLRAPMAGLVVARDAVVGQPVTPEQTLATLADLSEAWFLARVFEKDLGRLAIGARADVRLNAYPKERFDGTVEYLGRQVDPVARTLTARIRLTNRGDLLRLGLFGTARVATGEDAKPEPVLVVPTTSITEVAGKPVVFVRQADDTFELHEVVLGDASLGKVAVTNGLREGEQVVVEGTFTLKSVVLKSTIADEEEP